jgi:Arc/MetJ-type ribon-helix-helix transcriptional regulator
LLGIRAEVGVLSFPSACLYGKTVFMAKSIPVKPKRGRPPSGGRDPFVGIRLPASLIDQIALWSDERDVASRSEAIRRLVELGLKAEKPIKAARSTPNKVRAAELAAKAIGMMVDVSAPPEEINRRRQRLTKGPPEFREHRVDLPKAEK